MKPATAWLLRHFPYSLLVKNQSRILRLGVAIFITAFIYALINVGSLHLPLLLALILAFILLFISSYLPRKETKITSLVTQTGALELIDLSPLPVFTYEKRKDDIYIRFANTACRTMLSDQAKSLIGKPINQLVMLEDEEEMLSACLETLEHKELGNNRTFFIRSRHTDGSVIKLMCATSKVKWLEQYIGICFLFDISKAENQYVAMQEHVNEGYKSTLIAGIVHDFRNVLTSIIGTAEALQFTTEDKNIIEKLDVIIDAGERGSATITDILQLSSSANQTETNIEYNDITSDIRSIISLLRLQLPSNIKLSYRIENNLPHIKINTTKLEQILMNLVNNATQAMDKDAGTIAVHVSKDKTPDNKQAVKIVVSDNGCGISQENLSKVTDNFWSLRKTKGGTGLGMAMVKRIVNGLGGILEIKSELAVGTQISLCFPSQQETDSKAVDQSPQKSENKTQNSFTPTEIAPLKAKPCTILLVDDQPSVLHVQQMLLEAMGHQVITAMNGSDAIKMFDKEKEHIQMLVTDFKMPDMDGVDLAKKLRKESSSLPLLMVTAYGETEKLSQAEGLNMTMILKPTNLKKFSEAIIETQLKYPNIFS